MIRIATVLFLTVILLPALMLGQTKPKKALFIIVDGIPADVVEKVNTSNLDKIAAAGQYLRSYVGGEKDGYSQTPTISAVSYNSLLTGTWVNKHNVWDNNIRAPNYNYSTIFKLYKEQYPRGKTAVFSSWTDNRTKLIGEGLSQTGNFKLDYKVDGFELDTVSFPHDKGREFMHKIDEQVTTETVASIEKSAPDLSWVYLEYTDDMGHMYGDSPQFYSAVEKMDNQIGRIWSAIQLRQKKYGEDWLIFVTTDHGRDEKTGKGHGGQTDRQRTTWMVTNLKSLNTYARYSQPAIVDILPTLARHLGVTIPKEKEIDGVPLEGPVSLAHPKAVFIQNTIDVSWQVYDERGKARVWLSTTNNLKNGAKDEYKLAGEVPVKQGHMLIDLKDQRSQFYKILVEGPYNTVNRWVVLSDNSEKK